MWASPGSGSGLAPILFEGLQDERHRNHFAVVVGKHREGCWISKPAMNLLLCPDELLAGHRTQRQPGLNVSGDVGGYRG